MRFGLRHLTITTYAISFIVFLLFGLVSCGNETPNVSMLAAGDSARVTARWTPSQIDTVHYDVEYEWQSADQSGTTQDTSVVFYVPKTDTEQTFNFCVTPVLLPEGMRGPVNCKSYIVPAKEIPQNISLHITKVRYADGLPDTLDAGAAYYIRVDSPDWNADLLGYDLRDAPGMESVTFYINGSQTNVENLYPYEINPRTRTFTAGSVIISARVVTIDSTFTLSHTATVIGGTTPPDTTPPPPPDTVPPPPPDTTPPPVVDTTSNYLLYAEPSHDCYIFDGDTLQTGGYSLAWIPKDSTVTIDSIGATLKNVSLRHNPNCGTTPGVGWDDEPVYCPNNYGIQQDGSHGWQELTYTVYGSSPETKTLHLYFHDGAGNRCSQIDSLATIGYLHLSTPQNLRLELRENISNVGDIIDFRWDAVPEQRQYDPTTIGELVYYMVSIWEGTEPWSPDKPTVYLQGTWMGGTVRTLLHRPPLESWTPLPDTMTACVQAIAVEDESKGYEGPGGFLLATFPTYGREQYPEPSGYVTTGPWPLSKTQCQVLVNPLSN